jgi:hypothetical protein
MTVVAGMIVLPARDSMKTPDDAGVVPGAADAAAVDHVAREAHRPVAAQLDAVDAVAAPGSGRGDGVVDEVDLAVRLGRMEPQEGRGPAPSRCRRSS